MPKAGKALHLPPLLKSLSARLLLLTIFFVMLAEVLIYAPSIARFRLNFLEDRLAAGHLAMLTLEATPNQVVGDELKTELLDHVGAHFVAMSVPDRARLMLMSSLPPAVDATYDLREAGPIDLLQDAFKSMLSSGDRTLRVIGPAPKNPDLLMEVVLDEKPLCEAMFAFSQRILALSLVISLITAALVYLSLLWLMVRPMRRMTESMVRFRDDPEDVHNMIAPTERGDEIGVAQHELARMQEGLRSALTQKTRLAALGTAVNKINHDLRNILSTAQLVSDRLETSQDPEVQRIKPTLMKSIGRAISLCERTLDFTREGPPRLTLEEIDLQALVDDVGGEMATAMNGEAAWRNELPEDVRIEADRDQLYRIFANLGQNAFEAGATEVRLNAQQRNGRVRIIVEDNGPGLPPRAQKHLFTPFAGTARPGGTGLGLAIARDLARAHGGDITLRESTATGTSFRLDLPVHPKPRGRARNAAGPGKGGR